VSAPAIEAGAPPAPGTPEWLKLMTASKVAAVFGISPWDSPVSLWLKMKGIWIEEKAVTNAMSRGTYLENGLLDWWADQHPEWPELTRQYYATRPEYPGMAATCDGRATNGMRGRLERSVLVEAKTASKMEEWGTQFTDQIPPYYKAQVDFQLGMVPEASFAYVPVLGPFNDLREYVVERDEERIALVMSKAMEFIASLDQDAPPPLDDHEATFTAIKAVNPDIDKGNSVEVTLEEALEFLRSTEDEKTAVARARGAKVVILNAAKTAQYVTAPGAVRVARRQPNRSGISLVPVGKAEDLEQRVADALAQEVQAVVTETTAS